MNNILQGSPLLQYSSSLTPDDYIEKNNVDLENTNNGLFRDIENDFDIGLNTIEQEPLFENSTEIIAIKGNYETTELSTIYFSKNNIDSIQKSIRYYVHQKTNTVIDAQSENEIYIIMRSILFQHGDQSIRGVDNILYEIQKLNKLTIQFSVDTIVSEVKMYEKYIHDLQNLQVPIDNPEYNNKRQTEQGHPYL
tara:strand:+ start:711 stop:1292 length:582 start_codon:yes stop_codon:yes gene_type:complete